jgi:hypothetical protein
MTVMYNEVTLSKMSKMGKKLTFITPLQINNIYIYISYRRHETFREHNYANKDSTVLVVEGVFPSVVLT